MIYTKLTFNIKSAPKPYPFIGSKMRGMLGYALKDEVCINPTLKCDGCFAANECVFYDMYEKQNATHKYRLDFKLYSDKYKFSLLLFDDLQKHANVIEKAMISALKEYKKVKAKQKDKVFKQTKKHPSVLKLTLLTPLRIKKQNRSDKITITDILNSIHKRDTYIHGKTYVPLPVEKECRLVTEKLRFVDVNRRSNKQNMFMKMGGLMGEMVLSGVSKEEYALLKLGEVIAVGKSTVFGLGKIKIEEIA